MRVTLVNEIISTIFLIYRRFDKGYRLTDNYRRNSPAILKTQPTAQTQSAAS